MNTQQSGINHPHTIVREKFNSSAAFQKGLISDIFLYAVLVFHDTKTSLCFRIFLSYCTVCLSLPNDWPAIFVQI